MPAQSLDQAAFTNSFVDELRGETNPNQGSRQVPGYTYSHVTPTPVADPVFVGFHLLAKSGMSSKMVPKAYPEERVGHFCRQQGRVVVIEYSDMPMAMQREINPDGTLRYSAGSIAIHVIDREFARMMAGPAVAKAMAGSSRPAKSGTGEAAAKAPVLPFHRADKKISTVDAAGRPVKPEKANGVKFEMFVFDALPFACNSIVVETARADDFSPVKNAEGVDSPQSARDDQLRQFARWLKSVGVAVEVDATGRPKCGIEVSPLFGYDSETFAKRWRNLPLKPLIADGLYLESSQAV